MLFRHNSCGFFRPQQGRKIRACNHCRKLRFVDQRDGVVEAEPGAAAHRLLCPFAGDFGHLHDVDGDLDGHEAVRQPLPVRIAAIGSRTTRPVTPASSRASIAAALGSLFPFIGQPFGMMTRCVVREVTSMSSSSPTSFSRQGIAATCLIVLAFRALWMSLLFFGISRKE